MKKPKNLSDISLDIQDAIAPLKFTVSKDDVWGSEKKIGKGKPLTYCVQENAIRRLPAVLDCKVYRTTAYVIMKKNPRLALRFIPTQDGKRVADINDRLGKKGLLKELVFPIELELAVPRKARSLKTLRSQDMKDARKKSLAKRAGKPKRPYNNPTTHGFRNGTGIGKAHIWQALGGVQ